MELIISGLKILFFWVKISGLKLVFLCLILVIDFIVQMFSSDG